MLSERITNLSQDTITKKDCYFFIRWI